VDQVNEPAAWRELDDAISAALARYAQAVIPDDALGRARRMHLARLSAARRALAILRAAETTAAAAAIEHGATYPMLADAAGMARQTAWKRYRPR
jgi:hypothetical protein